YLAVTDTQALEGFRMLTQLEGIIPALESSHAVYQARCVAQQMSSDTQIVICVSGRGDKDVNTVAEVLPTIGPKIGWDLRFQADPTKKQPLSAIHSFSLPALMQKTGFRSTAARYLSASRGSMSGANHSLPVSKAPDVEYCRRLVQQHDLDNYLVSLFSPRPVREAVWGIRAMNVELVRISEVTTSTTAAQMRFAYWHDAIKRLYSDDPVQTPISRCVHDAVRRYSISRTWLRRLVSERERMLESPTFETVADVEKYGERAYACLIHPHLEALGVRDMHADNAARAIG
ncbi:NADH dehydrogenase (ubiquinone) complex I, assembly factor 6, partial [Coemansia sp. RSA 486]